MGEAGAFDDGEADELSVMRRFGLRFDRIDLAAMSGRLEAVPAAHLRALRDALVNHPARGAVDLPDDQIFRTLRFGLAILGLVREGAYLGCTVKSWPEMFDHYHWAIDGAVSMLNDHGVVTAEVGEMNGPISSLALDLVSGGRAHGAARVRRAAARPARRRAGGTLRFHPRTEIRRMKTRLTDKLDRLRNNPDCGEFILADAKDADMAWGVPSPGPRDPADPDAGFVGMPAFRDRIRAVIDGR